MEQRNDEIDLLELSRNMMIRFYHYSIRRYKLLGIFIIIGAIIGIGLYLKDKHKYENTIIGTSYFIEPVYIVEIINSLNDINKDKETISKLLNLKINEAENLTNIAADTLESKKTIQIKLNFKNDFDLSNFSKRIVSYIDSNDFVKRELALYKNRNGEMIKSYDQEINKLDSLQSKILATKIDASQNQLGNLLVLNDKINNFFHKDIIELQSQKQSEIINTSRIKGFTIIDQKKGAKIKAVSLVSTVLKMMAVFFGIGFFVTLVLEFTRQVKYIEQSKKG